MDRCLYCYYFDMFSQECRYYNFLPYDPDEVQPECCKDDLCFDYDPDFNS